MIATVYGAKTMFCHPGCRDSFKQDRKLGLIYGQIEIDGKLYGWEQGSLLAGTCAYCGTYCGNTTANLRVRLRTKGEPA